MIITILVSLLGGLATGMGIGIGLPLGRMAVRWYEERQAPRPAAARRR